MDDGDDYIYSDRVAMQVREQQPASYVEAAEFINRAGYDVLSVQHEYGIFGGPAGSYLLDLVRQVNIPIVTTLHTVLEQPSEAQRVVMQELLDRSARVVVMSRKALKILTSVHSVRSVKIDLIPHGIPKVDAEDGAAMRSTLGIAGPMILTFGLLSPDKGIEYAIKAMPRIVERHPGATYVVLGATHPHVRASAGESYRESLLKLASELGVAANVRFENRFVPIEELVRWLGAMDVYITPYLKVEQITSGTLAYAVGAGKAVISTPYWYADEILADGRGMLVPFRDPDAIADSVLNLEDNEELKTEVGRKSAAFGKSMRWPQVGVRYLESFERAINEFPRSFPSSASLGEPAAARQSSTNDLCLDHLLELTDDTGIIQHAWFTVPNRDEGYCVDDNARALLFSLFHEQAYPFSGRLASSQARYLSFVLAAFNGKTGRFRNFMSYSREWLEESGSEDSHGRAMWALGSTVRRCGDSNRRDAARAVLAQGMPALFLTTSPRTWAYGVLACDELLAVEPDDKAAQAMLAELAIRLLRNFDQNSSSDWPWFEDSLAYANGRLCQALILASRVLGDHRMLKVGLWTLTWLAELQTASPVFSPVGSRGSKRRSRGFDDSDQQPIEAWSAISAYLTAYAATGNPVWYSEATRALRWYFGDNRAGLALFDPLSGGCCDGLHMNSVNRNQGAESTLAFLCSCAELNAAAKPLAATAGPEAVR